MQMRKNGLLRLALVLGASLSIGSAGCGSKVDGTTAEVDPNLGKKHKEMDDWMKNNKPEPGVNKKTMRDHP